MNLNVFADNAAELNAKPEQIAAHQRLVDQAVKAFGAQHYDHYEFLLSISDQLGGIGLEHHRSSENGVTPGYFTEWDAGPGRRNLLPHEFTHSWDGKFRRGADLWTPDYRTPMRDSLLWVYEGQTQFWGYVLQARSGMVSKQDTLDQYASILALYDTAPARQWRNLVDTTNDPIISSRKPKGWTSWQRSEDYYNEGLMVWMEVDAMLRQKTNGAKSIDDFAKAFFGIRNGDWGEVTYTFDDVAETLNKIVPMTGRVPAPADHRDGQARADPRFAMNGYKLVYTTRRPPPSSRREGQHQCQLFAGHDGGEQRRSHQFNLGQSGVQGGHRCRHANPGGERRKLFGRSAEGRDPRRQGPEDAGQAGDKEPGSVPRSDAQL